MLVGAGRLMPQNSQKNNDKKEMNAHLLIMPSEHVKFNHILFFFFFFSSIYSMQLNIVACYGIVFCASQRMCTYESVMTTSMERLEIICVCHFSFTNETGSAVFFIPLEHNATKTRKQGCYCHTDLSFVAIQTEVNMRWTGTMRTDRQSVNKINHQHISILSHSDL